MITLRASAVVYATLIIVLLVLVIFFLNTPDVYVAAGSAFVGDLYVLVLGHKYSKERIHASKFGVPSLALMVIGLPLILSGGLAILGVFGPPLETVLRIFITVGFSITFFFISFTVPLSIKHKYQEERTEFDPSYHPLVTVLVPAYNEGLVISRTLETLVNTDYDRKEIIVVDDGSTDNTYLIASWYRKYGVKVVQKPNGGKASALNYGLVFARGEIIITVDADSMITRTAIKEIVARMSDPRVVAVSGNIRVLNNNSFLTRCQELEYIIGINTLRRALDLFGAVMVVPGAFGAFRKEAMDNTGRYDRDTLTEDFDLTIKMLKAFRSVASSSAATAYTEVPTTLHSLYKQRLRWSTGTYQTLFKHKDAFFNERFGYLHKIVVPLLLLSIVMPFAAFAGLAAGFFLVFNGQPPLFAYMLILFFFIQLFVSLLTLSLEERDYSLAWYTPFFVIGYKNFLDCATIVSVFRVALKIEGKWGKTERVGGVPEIKAGRGV